MTLMSCGGSAPGDDGEQTDARLAEAEEHAPIILSAIESVGIK